MDDKERLKVLEQALAQMLKPVKGIPFSVLVKSLAQRQVIRMDKADVADIELLKRLEKAILSCAAELKSKFNSDNRRLYATSMMLLQGDF